MTRPEQVSVSSLVQPARSLPYAHARGPRVAPVSHAEAHHPSRSAGHGTIACPQTPLRCPPAKAGDLLTLDSAARRLPNPPSRLSPRHPVQPSAIMPSSAFGDHWLDRARRSARAARGLPQAAPSPSRPHSVDQGWRIRPEARRVTHAEALPPVDEKPSDPCERLRSAAGYWNAGRRTQTATACPSGRCSRPSSRLRELSMLRR